MSLKYDENFEIDMKEIGLTKEKFKQHLQISKEMLNEVADIDCLVREYCDAVVVSFQLHVLGRKNDEIKHPLDWVEAVKERFAPKWLLKKYPVRYKTYKVMEYYPKIAIPREEAVIRFKEDYQ